MPTYVEYDLRVKVVLDFVLPLQQLFELLVSQQPCQLLSVRSLLELHVLPVGVEGISRVDCTFIHDSKWRLDGS